MLYEVITCKCAREVTTPAPGSNVLQIFEIPFSVRDGIAIIRNNFV